MFLSMICNNYDAFPDQTLISDQKQSESPGPNEDSNNPADDSNDTFVDKLG